MGAHLEVPPDQKGSHLEAPGLPCQRLGGGQNQTLAFTQPKDLMTIPLDDWQSSDVMWISAPCQPHCRIGKGLGDKDPRSLPFWRALEATKALANREDRPLKMVIIENSPGIMDTKKKAGTCFYKLINAWWASQMPTWTTLKPLF